jgi:atypical dual specificity phosphatase
MTPDCDAIIADRLWVGSYPRPEDVKQLKELGVTTVVSLQSDGDIAGEGISTKKLLKAYNAAQIKFLQVAINDFDKEDLLRNIPRCVAELEAALRPGAAKVYLHCTAGLNRAPTVAAAYLMRMQRMSPKDAYDYVLARRYCRPYLDVLHNYAASLKEAAPGQQ